MREVGACVGLLLLISLPPDIEPLFGVKRSWRGTWVVGSRVVCTEDAGEEEANGVVRVRASSVNCLKANMEVVGGREVVVRRWEGGERGRFKKQ